MPGGASADVMDLGGRASAAVLADRVTGELVGADRGPPGGSGSARANIGLRCASHQPSVPRTPGRSDCGSRARAARAVLPAGAAGGGSPCQPGRGAWELRRGQPVRGRGRPVTPERGHHSRPGRAVCDGRLRPGEVTTGRYQRGARVGVARQRHRHGGAVNERCHAARVSAAPSSPPGVARPYDTLCAPVDTWATASSGGIVAAYASHSAPRPGAGRRPTTRRRWLGLLDGQPAVCGRADRRSPRLPRRGSAHAALPLRWLPAA